jgi:endonuclease/exonuclease/phosphatase (EEP) superfamily protein YafD
LPMTIVLTIYVALLASFTLLPFVKSDFWIFRICEYPRSQKLLLTVIALLFIGISFQPTVLYGILAGSMIANAIYLVVQIFPFTMFAKKQVLRTEKDDADNAFTMMISNVLQFNEDVSGSLSEVKKADPDLLLLLEIDERWQNGMSELDELYPFNVKVPRDDTYGMLLYSRLELKNAEVKYLVEAHVPSIHAQFVLKSGAEVQFYGLHPSPPVPNENPRSTERDKELMLVADMAKASDLPAIVAGDLNDVAWSYTTKLFLKMSGLLDPRRGRGFFNTFNAKIPGLRYPLDHAFISQHFKLKSIRRLNNHGSDHFPMFLGLQYHHVPDKQQEPLTPSASDVQLAEEKKAAV